MTRLRLFRRIVLLAVLLPGAAQCIVLQDVRIRGVEGELLDNVRARVELARHPRDEPLTDAALAFLIRRAPRQVELALEPFGYYAPTVEVETRPLRGGLRATLRIRPGEPVRVMERQIALRGEGSADAELATLARRFQPRAGAVFSHPLYETSKADIERGLLERGYFRSRSEAARVEVEREARAARIDLAWRTGPRHHFGATRFEGSHLRDGLLDGLLPYREGQPYHQSELLALHRVLAELDYFGRIDIQPDLPEGRWRRDAAEAAQADAVVAAADAERRDRRPRDDDEDDDAEPPVVPIRVDLAPAKRTRYSAGLGYGTDSGGSVRVGMDRRWVNARGHKLSASGEFGQRRSLLGVQYRIPEFERLPGWWSAGVSVREEEIGGELSEIGMFTVSRSARLAGMAWLAEWNVQRESFERTELLRRVERSVTLVYPALRVERVETDDPLYPTRGHGLSAMLRAGARALGSDADFAQLSLAGRYVRSQGEHWRWLVRSELATTWSDDFERLPPSLRFYAGGDRSVRGYGYQELSPRDQLGLPEGARHLAVASVEVERRLVGPWGVAAFVDAGNAFDGGRFDPAVGVGLGLRWRSPVGPVRIDIGRGLDGPERSLRLHIGIGPEL